MKTWISFFFLIFTVFSFGESSSAYQGVNWADARDNFVDGKIIPSGIDAEAPLAEVERQAHGILSQLKELLAINTVRLGINPDTVGDADYWLKYQAIIEQAKKLKLKVILACWEGENARDGKIDDTPAFHKMWEQVLHDLGKSEHVHFEIFNEPYGYSDDEWREIAAGWLEKALPKMSKMPNRARILISGSGYNEWLSHVGADERFKGCHLSFHLYAWFGGKHRNREGWVKEIKERIGEANAHRTIVTEWGASMKSTPQDFFEQSKLAGRSKSRAYIIGMADVIHEWQMGSVYWPGLRDGDRFSLTKRTDEKLEITNESGKRQVMKSFRVDVTK